MQLLFDMFSTFQIELKLKVKTGYNAGPIPKYTVLPYRVLLPGTCRGGWHPSRKISRPRKFAYSMVIWYREERSSFLDEKLSYHLGKHTIGRLLLMKTGNPSVPFCWGGSICALALRTPCLKQAYLLLCYPRSV